MKNIAEAEDALVAVGKELEKNLANWEAWAAKADILCSLGMHEIAVRCCDKSLELNPNIGLTWITKGIALSKLGRTAEANEAFAKAKELRANPDSE